MGREGKKIIAWGASPIFELYARYADNPQIDYCVDISAEKQGKQMGELMIHPPEKLDEEDRECTVVVNFGLSSDSIQAINRQLCGLGFVLGENYLDSATFLRRSFDPKATSLLGRGLKENLFDFARSFNFNSSTPLQTTVLGNWLLLEILEQTRHLPGSVAEIGAYKGGNALLQLSAMSLLGDCRPYYVLDSFAGFDQLSEHDPAALQNAYAYDYGFEVIRSRLSVFPQAQVIRGFVPGAFAKIDPEARFSVVFYDCDLYQPALDTFEFFWDRIVDGGYLVIHDNIATDTGWFGVAKATQEFFAPKGAQIHDFWETTMSVIVK